MSGQVEPSIIDVSSEGRPFVRGVALVRPAGLPPAETRHRSNLRVKLAASSQQNDGQRHDRKGAVAHRGCPRYGRAGRQVADSPPTDAGHDGDEAAPHTRPTTPNSARC